MKPESIVLAIAGAFFGLIVGWIIGTQQAGPRALAGVPPAAAVQPAGGAAPAAQPQAPPLDEARVQVLRAAAEKNPSDAQSRVQLGNAYFDAERYGEAVTWYEAALGIDPKDPNVSTDLGVAYYYLNQPDRALEQFERSLAVDPAHTKTLLNQGIVRAFGRQDLKGAAESWQRLIAVAPTSPEADAARRALQGLQSAHPDLAGTAPAAQPPGK
ncbi:MAG TPA: tetratricopeptide repeat protein [Vicinamibacterales bacterium]|nr:tetratricopeptide repeat protein [Acidobacteriota bacterium]HOC17044.1 tetratricopeptide repeat protein [Vicinamibacterales bacterium]